MGASLGSGNTNSGSNKPCPCSHVTFGLMRETTNQNKPCSSIRKQCEEREQEGAPSGVGAREGLTGEQDKECPQAEGTVCAEGPEEKGLSG